MPKEKLVKKEKRKVARLDADKTKGKRKAAEFDEEVQPSKEQDEEQEVQKKPKKELSKKQAKRKEVTTLYSELISPGRERKTHDIVADILDLLSKRTGPNPLAQYCGTEIGSKVIQACLKWGNTTQRRSVLTNLKLRLGKLAIDPYGHVVVTKLLTYGAKTAVGWKPTAEEKKAQTQNIRDFLDAFHGKALRKAFFHKHGCRVINAIYFSEQISHKEKRLMLHEIAVPQSVSLLRPELPGTGPTLRQLLSQEEAKEGLSEEHRVAVMSHLAESVERCIDKELLSVDIVHLLLQAYCERATESQLRDLAEKAMPGAPYLLSSKPGAEALTYMLGVASAKQRKTLLKDLKGKFVAMATNAVDYVVMMRLVTTVDDTVLLEKTVLAEWISGLEIMCFDKYGQKVLAWLFRPADTKLFSPYECQYVTLPAPASLKASEKRYQELRRTIRPAVAGILRDAPLKAASDLHAKDLMVAYLAFQWDSEIVQALVDAAAKEAKNGDEEFGLLGSGTTVTALQALMKREPPAGENVVALAQPLWNRCFEPRVLAAALSRCSFLLLFMAKLGGNIGAAVKKSVVKHKEQIEVAAKSAEAEGKVKNGTRHLLEAAKA